MDDVFGTEVENAEEHLASGLLEVRRSVARPLGEIRIGRLEAVDPGAYLPLEDLARARQVDAGLASDRRHEIIGDIDDQMRDGTLREFFDDGTLLDDRRRDAPNFLHCGAMVLLSARDQTVVPLKFLLERRERNLVR